jgi:uncharacterized radical SAM protein YgiQ
MSFLPINKKYLKDYNWENVDFILVSGDAYVDHPSFGHSIISRVLEFEGYKVGIIPQPDWKNVNEFKILGRPKLGFLVTSGVIDSMVNHYTANKKTRSNDIYSPGGKSGLRPDRAIIVYTNMIKRAYKDVPVIIGGIEASLRRFSHYDYWDNKVRKSVLFDSKADILVYGMGEKPIIQIANRLKNGESIDDIRGTAVIKNSLGNFEIDNYIKVYSHEEVKESKIKYAKAFVQQNKEQDFFGRAIIQKCGTRYLLQNPPIKPLSISEMDKIYSLPYERTYHPVYEDDGGVPSIKEVEFSITSHRGCFGGCSFCALNFHQGRVIQKRSKKSIVTEANKIRWSKNFKGYIHDIGGPTANFRNKACKKQEKFGVCKEKQCLHPKACKNLIIDHREYLDILKTVRSIEGIKKVFIRSGIRYDYLIYDKNKTFFNELCKNHISGQLKVAPEHVVDRVLDLMGKPKRQVYDKFVSEYFNINKKHNMNQFLVPYLISSHPGSDMKSAIYMAEYLNEIGYNPEQVQDFYPTPGTLSTCMFYTGIDPNTNKKIYVAKNMEEKRKQRAMLQYRKRENYHIVYKILKEENREDLIGFDKKCLIRPKIYKEKDNSIQKKSKINKKSNRNNRNNSNKYDKIIIRNKNKRKNKR